MFLLLRRLDRRHRAGSSGGSPSSRPRPRTTASRAPASAGRLALALHQAGYDLRAFLRNKQARYFTLILPLILLVMFVSIFGNNTVGPDHVKASTYYVPGVSALAVIAACFVNLVISITTQRETGVLKRRRATPVPASVLIVLLAEATGFDLERREVVLDHLPNHDGRAAISYDTLIVAGGSRYSYFGTASGRRTRRS